MFQKEVADRILSQYNSSNYGRLSILANWKLNIKKLLILNLIVFHLNQKLIAHYYFFHQKKIF